MTQQTDTPEGVESTTPAEGANAIPPELQALVEAIQKDPAKTAEEIKKLRAEAKQRREDAGKAERERAKAEADRLEADKEWQKAADAYKKQVDALLPRAERTEALEQFVADMAQKRLDALPKQYRSLDPKYDDPLKTLQWLEANAATFALPALPNIGAGEQGDRTPQAVAKLTPEEVALAKQFGMTPEQFAQYKARQKPEGSR